MKYVFDSDGFNADLWCSDVMGVSCGDDGVWRNPEKKNISWENQTPLEKWITAATKVLIPDKNTPLSPYICPQRKGEKKYYIDWSGRCTTGCRDSEFFCMSW